MGIEIVRNRAGTEFRVDGVLWKDLSWYKKIAASLLVPPLLIICSLLVVVCLVLVLVMLVGVMISLPFLIIIAIILAIIGKCETKAKYEERYYY